MKVGDKVVWTSQANGATIEKRGVIIAVVPINHIYTLYDIGIDARAYDRSALSGFLIGRKEESYIVKVESGGRAKPKLYWPRVSALKIAESAK